MGLPFPDGPCAGTTVAAQELGCPGRVVMGCRPRALHHATTTTETVAGTFLRPRHCHLAAWYLVTLLPPDPKEFPQMCQEQFLTDWSVSSSALASLLVVIAWWEAEVAGTCWSKGLLTELTGGASLCGRTVGPLTEVARRAGRHGTRAQLP